MDYLVAFLGIALLGGAWIGIERLVGDRDREPEAGGCAACGEGCPGAREE